MTAIERRNAPALLSLSLLLAAAGLPCAYAQPDANAAGQPNGRRVIEGPPTALAFRNVTVEEMLSFITQATGKVVMPQPDVLTRRITVMNDTPVPRAQALDLVFLALQQNGVAVVESDTTITLRDINEITRQDVPVVPSDVSVLGRTDQGTIVEKVFALRHSTAKSIGTIIKDSLPQFAKLSVDEESNQVAVMGNISLLQRLERLITSLDRPAAGALQTETFRLRYADAELIKANIEELFSASTRRQQQGGREQQNQGPQWRFGGQVGGEQSTAASTELRVSANTQQNSVTVVADPTILGQIRTQIETEWDKPLTEEAVVPKVYDIKYNDPVKVRDLLEGLFGRASTTAGAQRAQGGGQQQPATGASQGVGRLAGQFSFQAIPDSGRLVVVAKSPDNIAVIDKIIQELDQPQTVGLPTVIELKHASAEDLAEQLNALLSQDGTLAQIRRAASGLTESASTVSPFANADAATDTANTQNTVQNLSFWWQQARPPTDRRSSSNLIGKLRIVPVWRQNALMVVAPPEYEASVLKMIEHLDKPGRQVLISAIIAEIATDDATALGLRWSSSPITPTNPDNAIGIGTEASGTRNNFAESLFNTSVLNVNADLNVVLQALAQKTTTRILSEPRIFTSDNQEAEFFDGQDIPFITDSQTSDNNNLVQSFDYKAVGIQLRVRPRITVRADVDLKVNVELSSIVPGQTLFGGFIVERRETTTQLIVKNSQTVVISGILRSEESDVVRKVPLLGDIPILGYLFKSREKSKVHTELLVFITPVVVDNTDSSNPVNAPYRDRLKEMRDELQGDVRGIIHDQPDDPKPEPKPADAS